MIDFTGVTALRIPEGDVTKVVRKSDSVVLWEKVTGRLPREYQEVEYIHIPSGAYINTGFIPADDTTFYIKVRPLAGYGFGTGQAPRLAISNDTNSAFVQIYNVSNGVNGIFEYHVPDGRIDTEMFEITTHSSKGECQTWVNGKTNGGVGPDVGTYWNMSFTNPMYIGAWRYNATTLRTGTSDVFAVRAQIGSTQYLDLVPCYRKSDNACGMYNLVDGAFLTNAGTGTITKGPNVVLGSTGTTIPIVWKPGYCCEHATGKSFIPFVNSSYTVSEAVEVEPGTTYTLSIIATATSSFRFVGANSNDIVTEAINNNIVIGDNTFTFTPSNGTTQMRIRTYTGNEIWTWKLSKG